MNEKEKEKAIARGRKVLEIEAHAVRVLAERLDDSFLAAVEKILACQGKVIVLGIGKSGLVGRKIAATLASTGTPAFFVHPAEGVHGDLGMIDKKDVVLLVSNSGETEELLALAPAFKRLGVPIIGLLGNPGSSLAKVCEVVIDASVEKEACPLNLAPTASTTAALAMGDALALTLLELKGFTEEDFARLHPSGALGKRLLLRVSDLMHTGEALPVVGPDTPFQEVIYEISSKMLGHAAVVEGDKLVGVITDGDLRRAMQKDREVHLKTAKDIMTRNPKTITADALAASALQMMERHSITGLLVVEGEEKRLVGIIHLHDLLKAGVV